MFLGVHAVNPVNGEHDPGLRRALRADGVRHGRDHGGARARPARLRVRAPARPAGAGRDPARAARTRSTPATMTEALPHDGVMVNSGPFDGEPSPGLDREGDRLARDRGSGAGRGELPACGTGCSAASGTGARRSRSSTAPPAARSPCPTTSCPSCCPTTPISSWVGSRRWLATPHGSTSPVPSCGGEADARHRHDGHVRRFELVLLPVLLTRRTRTVPFRREDVDRWMPVGQYTGGVEHAILHLLYSRFFTKVLYDLDMVGFTEPFPKLMNQGQVIYDGASMSKSKGNIVEPMPLVERWGADSMRLIMLFAGPFEDDIDWKLIAGEDPDRRPGVHSWLGRVFAVVDDAVATGCGRARDAGAPDPQDDQGRHRGPRAVPVQHRDLEAAGADERDADAPSTRAAERAGAARGAGADAGAVRALRRRRAVARGAGTRGVGAPSRLAGVRPCAGRPTTP